MSSAEATRSGQVEELRFGVMGTVAHVVVVGAPPGVADLAARRLADLEAKWSRFLPDSELSRLNALPGRPVVVSPETYRVIELSVRSWRLTAGRFDPTVLPALIAAGYDRSFEQLLAGPPAARGGEGRPAPGCDGIELLPALPGVILPPGRELDLGGIGKGCAADLVVGDLLAAGAAGACVNVGGDLRVAGEPPAWDGWIVGIENPDDPPSDLVRVGLVAGAMATSTDRRRRWTQGGEVRHHLIEPRHGRPAESWVAAATVVAGEAWLAEVLAKVCFLAPEEAPALLASSRAAGLLADQHGGVHFLNGMEDYVL